MTYGVYAYRRSEPPGPERKIMSAKPKQLIIGKNIIEEAHVAPGVKAVRIRRDDGSMTTSLKSWEEVALSALLNHIEEQSTKPGFHDLKRLLEK